MAFAKDKKAPLAPFGNSASMICAAPRARREFAIRSGGLGNGGGEVERDFIRRASLLSGRGRAWGRGRPVGGLALGGAALLVRVIKRGMDWRKHTGCRHRVAHYHRCAINGAVHWHPGNAPTLCLFRDEYIPMVTDAHLLAAFISAAPSSAGGGAL